MKSIIIKDEALSGDILNEITLKFKNEYITVAELIKARVTVEVEKYYKSSEIYRNGLVLPTNLEMRLNKKKAPKIDIEEQVYIALDAFQKNGFFILVDNEQVENLEQQILVDETTSISFLKLTPLVGG
ncbi:hypothetical protein [Tenacibaculum agarivorans]|uniref:hypothetical protein n=1 Tax=Tenacibaculum agarivorans TaxID=1908389 RepID=UPI00094BA99E|nr:hypothetical protein [Tenacibaculum agarivorans]